MRFLGVFDTVGALGVPIDWIKMITADLPHLNLQFHDTRLCGNVDVACQALAVDEQRGPYEPTWWEEPEPGAPRPEKVLQVWFAGVHSDIGGGYADDKALAEVPLGWMLEQAREAGLDLSAGLPAWPVKGDPGGRLHESMSLKWRFAHLLPDIDPYRRPIGAGQRAERRLPPIPGEKLHWSVVDRIQGDAAGRLGRTRLPARSAAARRRAAGARPAGLPRPRRAARARGTAGDDRRRGAGDPARPLAVRRADPGRGRFAALAAAAPAAGRRGAQLRGPLAPRPRARLASDRMKPSPARLNH